MIKQALSAVAFAALASGAANAQVTFAAGSTTSISNYNPSGAAALISTVNLAGVVDSLLSSTTGGTLTATFLGKEADDTDTFTFSFGSTTIFNNGALGATSTGSVAAGNLVFLFSDMTTPANNVGNGGNASAYASYAVLGNIVGGSFVAYTAGGAYDLVLGFNDGLKVDADYDDLVVGLKLTPAIPEPETYALMLAGLGAVAYMSRRRKQA